MPGSRACRSHANAVRLSADRSETFSAALTSCPTPSSHWSGRSPCTGGPPPRPGRARRRSSSRTTPSLPASAHDPIASHRPSRPISSSSVAPAHRHSGPDSSATAAASPGPGAQVSPAPSSANLASRGSRPGPAAPGPRRLRRLRCAGTRGPTVRLVRAQPLTAARRERPRCRLGRTRGLAALWPAAARRNGRVAAGQPRSRASYGLARDSRRVAAPARERSHRRLAQAPAGR